MEEFGFALLTYNSIYRTHGNLGDEIQSLAARQFLPRVDRYVDRERLHIEPWRHKKRLKIILNGWFLLQPSAWPPHEKYQPLLTSMHFNDAPIRRIFSPPPASSVVVRPPNLPYLKKFEPIGARDLDTRVHLAAFGVNAYLSGCLTLTLNRPSRAEKQDYVVANDLDTKSLRMVRQIVGPNLVVCSQIDTATSDVERRFEKAKELLTLFAGARSVITTRLHCALPCLAFGVPVLLLLPPKRRTRFSGLLNLVRSCSREELVTALEEFSPLQPVANSEAYFPYRDMLRTRCEQFVANASRAP